MAKPPNAPKSNGHQATSTSTTTTTTPKKSKCQQVELKGEATAGSVTFDVTKASKRGRDLVGKSLSLTIPVDAKVKAKVCSVEGGGFTLRLLHVNVPQAKP